MQGREESRPAAPRRSLLRRMHMPVGKAVALAAMPSAALLGMGFTSPLAKADGQPDNPFRPGSCVEVPDEPPAEDEEEPATAAEGEPEEGEDEEHADEEHAEERAEEPAETEDAEDATEPAGDADAPEDDRPTADREPDGAAADADAEGGDAEQPADEDAFDPLDPLGVGEDLERLGERIRDAFTPERDRPEDDAAESERAPEEEPGEEPGEEPEGGAASDEDAAEGADAAAESPDEDAAGDVPEDAAEDVTDDTAEESDESGTTGRAEGARQEDAAPETAPEPDPFAPDEDGLVPFPCPEERSVPGEDEQTALTLPDDPWYLEATSLTLRGLSYHGVVNVTTANGASKQALKFTADELDIGDLHQIVDGPDGVRYHVATAPDSTSTFRNGTVTMYTERLEGKLFGIIPITFDPEHEPPLDLPAIFFTDVLVTQAGQFGGELTLPGMHNYIEPAG